MRREIALFESESSAMLQGTGTRYEVRVPDLWLGWSMEDCHPPASTSFGLLYTAAEGGCSVVFPHGGPEYECQCSYSYLRTRTVLVVHGPG